MGVPLPQGGLYILRRHVREYECLFVFFRGTGKPCKGGKHKSRNRKQICFHEAEQSLFSNMACVTVCLLEKTGTKSTPVRMMPPSGPGISRAQSWERDWGLVQRRQI